MTTHEDNYVDRNFISMDKIFSEFGLETQNYDSDEEMFEQP